MKKFMPFLFEIKGRCDKMINGEICVLCEREKI